MRFEGPLVPATFKARHNRFLGEVEMDGEHTLCYIPNPGRMEELLNIDAKVHLLERVPELRKTRYDLVLVNLGGVLISVDSRAPNKVVAEAIEAGLLPEFHSLRIDRREPVFMDSRLDFRLTGGSASLMMEVKSCTLVKGRTGLFPDAPTERGRRHFHALVRALDLGRAVMLFLIQREDADVFQPNRGTDPEFAEALREAAERGVEVYAYNSKVTLEGISINKRVPVKL